VNKVKNNQLENIKKEILFYNFDDLNSNDNSKIVVKFNEVIETVTYSDLQFNDERDIFEYQKNILIEFIKKILDKIDEESCIIIKYNEQWLINREETKELSDILFEYSIDNNFNGGIQADKNSKIVELFIESVFKYNSFIQIILKNSQVVISPSDHMDIFFQTNNILEFKNMIVDNIKLLGNNLLIFEVDY
jgi:hypothetical protein